VKTKTFKVENGDVIISISLKQAALELNKVYHSKVHNNNFKAVERDGQFIIQEQVATGWRPSAKYTNYKSEAIALAALKALGCMAAQS
jgi:hypothetical protein